MPSAKGVIVRTETWIMAACTLLGLTGGMKLWQSMRESRDVASAEREERRHSEETEMPIRISDAPERWLPTSWNRLDEVGTNRRCNQDVFSQWQNETPCAASPADPDVIIVGANDFSTGSVMASYYRTSDGGHSWQHAFSGLGPIGNECSFAGDPSVAADATGRFYAVYCTYDCEWGQGVYCQTSRDNGCSWENPVSVGITGPGYVEIDKPMVVCDYGPGSSYANNCYVVWMQIIDGMSVYFSRSTNNGRSFSTPLRISSQNNCWCPSLAVGPEGQVYAAWIGIDLRSIFCDRSVNGGLSWGNDIRVTTFADSVWPDNPCGEFRITHYPVIACDISDSDYHGHIYLCWDMKDNADDGNIYFCRSTNGGQTWSDTARVNDDGTVRMQWWPWIAVHPRTGDIGISWLDRREDPNNCNYSVYGTISTDGGANWLPNIRISDQILDPSRSTFLGDYTGITYSNLGFVSAWTDTRNDECDAYAAWWN
ncbi:MAG: hypothetical protein ACOZB3_09445, partial [Calditrichota bacterium]